MSIDRRMLLASAIAAPAFLCARQTFAADPPWMILAGQDSGPLGRWAHTLVADTVNNRLLVAGGRDERGTVRGDLWSFDLATLTWTALDLSGPKTRSGSASAMAPDGSGFYYFAGESDDTIFDDLWWFDFATTSWQLLEPASGPRPGARAGTAGAIDPLGHFVISHGRNRDRLLDDTWAFDPSTGAWTDRSPDPASRPMARSDHEMLSLPGYGQILLFGGCSEGVGPCPQGDLWSFDATSGIWTDVTPGFGPTPRTGTALSQLGGAILAVGGFTQLGPESDVWRGYFDGYTIGWTELTYVNHGPMGIYRRVLHDMTAAGNEFYVFGGRGVEGALGDLWQFSLQRFDQTVGNIDPEGDYVNPDDYVE